MKIGILSMENYEHRTKGSVGSSRIRVEWLLNYWPEAEAFKIGQKYDAVIFQKAYWPEWLAAFDGIKIFDMCDPDWIDGKPVKECIELCDYVTTSTESLAVYIRTITEKPVMCVPDRVDLAEHMAKKEHKGKAKRAVWFGYHHNQKTVDQCLRTIKRLGLGLTVISDMPYYPQARIEGIDDDWIKENVVNMKFDWSTLTSDLINGGDMVLNPRIEAGRFKFKSNNKTLTAWALALPVAYDEDDMERFMNEEERGKEAAERLREIAEHWDVRASVATYKEILESIKK